MDSHRAAVVVPEAISKVHVQEAEHDNEVLLKAFLIKNKAAADAQGHSLTTRDLAKWAATTDDLSESNFSRVPQSMESPASASKHPTTAATAVELLQAAMPALKEHLPASPVNPTEELNARKTKRSSAARKHRRQAKKHSSDRKWDKYFKATSDSAAAFATVQHDRAFLVEQKPADIRVLCRVRGWDDDQAKSLLLERQRALNQIAQRKSRKSKRTQKGKQSAGSEHGSDSQSEGAVEDNASASSPSSPLSRDQNDDQVAGTQAQNPSATRAAQQPSPVATEPKPELQPQPTTFRAPTAHFGGRSAKSAFVQQPTVASMVAQQQHMMQQQQQPQSFQMGVMPPTWTGAPMYMPTTVPPMYYPSPNYAASGPTPYPPYMGMGMGMAAATPFPFPMYSTTNPAMLMANSATPVFPVAGSQTLQVQHSDSEAAEGIVMLQSSE